MWVFVVVGFASKNFFFLVGFYTSAGSWWWRWGGCYGGGVNGFHCGFTEVAMNFCCGFYAGWQIERKREA